MPFIPFHGRFVLVDLGAAVVFILFSIITWIRPLIFSAQIEAVERFGASIVNRRTVAVLIIALLPIVVRLCFLVVMPIPAAGVTDEFSYLLAADTFVHGRLTNPPHPMWPFFEASHINQLPTYMSKYPPAQGAILAIGKVFGHPWIGVLISVSGMSAAMFWMLRGWLPPRWAFLGALLGILRLGIFSYWINSYWGGAVPAIGGALVMGSLPRLMRSKRVRDAVLFAIGLSLLANSRPLEGLIVCISGVALALMVFQNANPAGVRRLARQLISIPVIVILFLTVLFMGYYNWRGTGNALLFPYTVNDRAYLIAPHFIWQSSAAPKYSANPQMDLLFRWELRYWNKYRFNSVGHLLNHVSSVGGKFLYFFLLPNLVLPFALVVFLLRDTKLRFFFLQFAICFLGMVAVVWSQPHYAAPLTAGIFVMIAQAIRHLRLWKYRGRPVGLGLARAVVIFSIGMTFVYAGEAISNPFLSSYVGPAGVWGNPGNRMREEILSRLNGLPGNHLVMVRYSTGTGETGEWIFNPADIDHAKVVWACEIPGVESGPLLRHFQGRHVWLLEPRYSPPRLTEYRENTGK